jgi:hypothetical protein
MEEAKDTTAITIARLMGQRGPNKESYRIQAMVRSRLERMVSPPMEDENCRDYAAKEERTLYDFLRPYLAQHSPTYEYVCQGREVVWEMRNYLQG